MSDGSAHEQAHRWVYASAEGTPEDRLYQGDIFRGFPIFELDGPELQIVRESGEGESLRVEVESPTRYTDAWARPGTAGDEWLVCNARRTDIMVVTQTCDLQPRALDERPFIVYCPVHPASEVESWTGMNPGDQASVRRNPSKLSWNLCYLPPCPDAGFDESLADLTRVSTIRKFVDDGGIVQTFTRAGARRILHMHPPYLEFLSRRFAELYARVALPTPLGPPPFHGLLLEALSAESDAASG